MHLNVSFTSLTHLNATILKGGKTKRQFALCSCSTYVNQVSTYSERLKCSAITEPSNSGHSAPPKKAKSKVSLTSTQPTDMKVKQTQRTSILVFSISSLSFFSSSSSLWLSPPSRPSFYTCRPSITRTLIRKGKTRNAPTVPGNSS